MFKSTQPVPLLLLSSKQRHRRRNRLTVLFSRPLFLGFKFCKVKAAFKDSWALRKGFARDAHRVARLLCSVSPVSSDLRDPKRLHGCVTNVPILTSMFAENARLLQARYYFNGKSDPSRACNNDVTSVDLKPRATCGLDCTQTCKIP